MILLSNILYGLAVVLDMVIGFMIFVVVVQAIISWVNPDPHNQIVRFLNSATEPLIRPIRRYIPTVGRGIDLSPLVLLLALYFARAVLVRSLMQYSQVIAAGL